MRCRNRLPEACRLPWPVRQPPPHPPDLLQPHSGELPFLFGFFQNDAGNAEDQRVGEQMRTYWANFAKTGNPNGGGLTNWPKHDAKSGAYLEFTPDAKLVVKEGLRRPWCQVFEDAVKDKLKKADSH